MAFPDLPRPPGLRWLLGLRLVQNQSGFQGPHVVGNNFWNTSVAWLGLLGFPNNADTLSNGVLLPESERGNLVLHSAWATPRISRSTPMVSNSGASSRLVVGL